MYKPRLFLVAAVLAVSLCSAAYAAPPPTADTRQAFKNDAPAAAAHYLNPVHMQIARVVQVPCLAPASVLPSSVPAAREPVAHEHAALVACPGTPSVIGGGSADTPDRYRT